MDFTARFSVIGQLIDERSPSRRSEADPDLLAAIDFEFEPFEGSEPARIRRITVNPYGRTTAADLAHFPWRRLQRAAESLVAAQQHNSLDAWRDYSTKAERVTRTTGQLRYRRRGRPAHSHAKLYEVAQRYEQLCQAGERAPALRIAEEYNVNPSTARSWINRCRALGFLPPAHRGRAG
jgi:hypothetical protein